MNKTRGLFLTASLALALTFTCPAAYANEAVAYHNRGMELVEKQEYDKAISEFNEAIRLDPKFFKAYTMRGMAYQQKGDYDKAISDYTQAIRLNPDFRVAYSQRGDVYYEKEEYDKAISDYTQAIRLEPNFWVYFHRGSAYYFKKDYDKAIADHTEAIRLKPELPEPYNGRGFTYCAKGDYYKNIKKDYQSASQSYGKAIEDFQSSLRINPNNKDIQEQLKKVEDIRFAIEAMLGFQSGSINASGNELTDARDSKKYKSVKIGTQTWMAENLNYEASGSKCYENNSGNCAKYGRLYDWNTAMKVCPSGWHLPTDDEWTKLVNTVGEPVGTKLKSRSGWNGTDFYGFSALPGGIGFGSGSFDGASEFGSWWNATEYNANSAWCRNMNSGDDNVRYYLGKSNLFSVRCIKD